MLAVLTKFQHNYLLISESLLIMNEVMVLLNPRMLEKETAVIISPNLNEESKDEPVKGKQMINVTHLGETKKSENLNIVQNVTPPEVPI